MRRSALVVLTLVSMACAQVTPNAAVADDMPERIVAVGDIHGDYDNFVQVLKDTGIVNKRLRWDAGRTRLVQVGDIADRGPDTRRIVELLMKLEKQAKRKKGAVHVLIGNHESMNMQGDLRYVHPGEYAAFVDRNSEQRRDRYYEDTLKYIQANTPQEEWPVFDQAHRDAWNQRFPLGYVEHRIAWAPTGEIGSWVLSHDTVLKLEDTLFLHGGLTSAYADLSLTALNTRVRTELASPTGLSDDSLVNAPDGPLWSRRAATDAETPENAAEIDRVLAAYGAKRMIVGHTPRTGTVVPRFGGRVITIDVGLAAHYGGSIAALEIVGDTLTLVQAGQRIPLPTDDAGLVDYLETVAPLVPEPKRIQQYLEKRASDAAASAAEAASAEGG